MRLSLKMLLLFTGIVTGFLIGCGSWVSVKEDPALSGAKNLQSIGVAQFGVELGGNRFILQTNSKSDESTIIGNISGWCTVVKVVFGAPEPLTNYAVTKDTLGKISRDAWIKVLSGSTDYKVNLVKGVMSLNQFSNVSAEGEKINGIGNVTAISRQIGLAENAGTIKQLAGDAGVDAILAGKVKAFSDILRSTGERINQDNAFNPEKTTFTRDQFVNYIVVSYDWVLYDGKTGAAIGTSNDLNEYYAMKTPDQGAVALDVSPGNKTQLVKYLQSDDFVNSVLEQCTGEAQNYAYAVLPHFHGYFK